MANKNSQTEQTLKQHQVVEIDKREYDRLKEQSIELKLMKEDLSERIRSVDRIYQLLELLVQRELSVQANPAQQRFPVQQSQTIDAAILEMSSVFGNVFQDNIEDKNEKTVRPKVKLEGAYKQKYLEMIQRTKELTKTSTEAAK